MNDYIAYLSSLYEQAKPVFSSHAKMLSHKSPNDILTDADLKLNAFFVEAIQRDYPNARIIAEESENGELSDELTFVVDPLDGTCNFAHDLPLCGIQIAVFEKKKCVAAILGIPSENALYHATLGGGAYRNEEKLRARKEDRRGDGILILSDAYPDIPYFSRKAQFEFVESIQSDFLKTRLFGAACIDFTTLASAKAVAYVVLYRHIWDIAPGLLLAEEAGYLARSLKGEPYQYGNYGMILANNEENLEFLLEKVKPYLD